MRIFIASFLIVLQPDRTFERMGAVEQEVSKAAKLLIDTFERILFSPLPMPMHTLPPALTRSLPRALFDYLRKFNAWKLPNEKLLVSRIKHALVALCQGKLQVPRDEPENSLLNSEFRTQIDRLRGKLAEIAGREAVEAFQQENPFATEIFDMYDSTLPPAAAVAPSPAHAPATVPALPPADRITNEHLLHELMYDPNFQLTDEGTSCESAAARRVRDAFHRRFAIISLHFFFQHSISHPLPSQILGIPRHRH